MEENISEKSGFVRLAVGTALTAMGTSHLIKENGNRTLGFTMVMCGAMKVAEGIFLYCPTKAMVNSNMKDAMSSTIGDFLNGEELMSAFSGLYSNNGSPGQTTGNSNSSGNNSSNNSTMKNMASAPSEVAKTVTNVAPSGSAVGAAAKAVESVTNNKKSN